MSENEGGMTAEQVEELRSALTDALVGDYDRDRVTRRVKDALSALPPAPPTMPPLPDRLCAMRALVGRPLASASGWIDGYWNGQMFYAVNGTSWARHEIHDHEPLLARAEWLEERRVSDDEAFETATEDGFTPAWANSMLGGVKRLGFVLIRETQEEGR